MRFIVKVEWQEEDGTITRPDLGQIDSNALQSASDVGLKLSDTKPILTQLQNIVAKVQLDRYCQSVRCCPSCRLPRRVKDYRERRLDSVLGRIVVRAPRFQCCRACEDGGTYSPVSQLLAERVLPELWHLQAELAAELSYARAAALLRKILPTTGGLSAMTTRNRTVAIGNRIEQG